MAAASAVHLSIFGRQPTRLPRQRGNRSFATCRKVVSGEMHVAFAVTEPDAGNDITPHQDRRARRDGDNYIINGRKVFTTKAREGKNGCCC